MTGLVWRALELVVSLVPQRRVPRPLVTAMADEPRSTDDPQSQAHYWEIEMTPEQRLVTLDALRRYAEAGKAAIITAATSAVQLGRRVDLPLTKERLDFDALEQEAERQGVSVADIFYDRAGRVK